MSDKISLLIVDDEERFLRTLSERLGLRDFEVYPVTSGNEAIELARQKEIDLALVDLKMPGMDGEEVLGTLKREHPYMEVIILTGHGSIDSAVRCTAAGSNRFLQKPCRTDELLVVLQEAYQKRVKRLLKLKHEELAALERLALTESPLGIIRWLKELERNARGDSS
jgi:DNA-binding NtrC family response regulator